MAELSFYEFIDEACVLVLAAEQQGQEPVELGVPTKIYEAIRSAKLAELRRGGTLSLLGLRVVDAERATGPATVAGSASPELVFERRTDHEGG
ncbi:MAG: hypothetical protein GEV12_00200 [Micromonosporaceae bacterium]|nr:hypothetical protein [Micromonosporaceae bacterium]